MLRNLLFAVAWMLSGAAQAAVQIELWHAMPGAAGEELEALVQRFHAAQAGVRVQLVYQGGYDQTYSRALAARFSGGGPALVQAYEAASANLMAWRGAAKPAWQLMEEAGERLDARAFVPAVASAFADAAGRLVALPLNTATPILYYNKAAFRHAGLDPERAPRTWYEMAGTLGALAESGMRCGYATASPAWVLLENSSLWHNQVFATRANGVDGADAKLVFNTHLMMRFISMLSSWAQAGYYTPAGRGEEAEALFAEGHCGLLTAASSAHARLAPGARFAIGTAALPYYDDVPGAPQNTVVGGAALWALGGRRPEEYRAVARFFAWLLRPEVQAQWHQRTGYLPATLAAYEASRRAGFYRLQAGQEVALRQLAARPTSDSRAIRLGDYRWIRVLLDEELEAVWSRARTPKEALDRAAERGNEVLRRFEAAHRAPR